MRTLMATVTTLCLAGAVYLEGQARRPASPEGTSATQVNDRWIEIVYGRPILRGRTNIFGTGADYGKVLFDGGTGLARGSRTSRRA